MAFLFGKKKSPSYSPLDTNTIEIKNIPKKWKRFFFEPAKKCIGWSESKATYYMLLFGYLNFRVTDWPPNTKVKLKNVKYGVLDFHMWEGQIEAIEYRTKGFFLRVEKSRETGKFIETFASSIKNEEKKSFFKELFERIIIG